MKSLHIKRKEKTFSVPAIFVDKYMAATDESVVKTYLYLLCHLEDGDFSFDAASEGIGISAKELERALLYLDDKGIIRLTTEDDDVSVEFLPLAGKEVAASEERAIVERDVTSRPPKYLIRDINNVLNSDNEIRDMFLLAEQLTGTSLSHNDMKILYSFYDWLKLPVDVILLLLEHCTSLKKSDFRYIEKIAMSWADNGIDNFEKASIYVRSQTKFNRAAKKLKRILQIADRDFTERELKFVRTWIEDKGYTESNFKEAYEITIMNTSKLTFRYMDTVLKNLGKEKGNAKIPASKKTKFNNYSGDENISEFEKKMIAHRMNKAQQ